MKPAIMDSYPSGVVSPNKPFLLWAALVTAYYHLNRKVIQHLFSVMFPLSVVKTSHYSSQHLPEV